MFQFKKNEKKSKKVKKVKKSHFFSKNSLQIMTFFEKHDENHRFLVIFRLDIYKYRMTKNDFFGHFLVIFGHFLSFFVIFIKLTLCFLFVINFVEQIKINII